MNTNKTKAELIEENAYLDYLEAINEEYLRYKDIEKELDRT